MTQPPITALHPPSLLRQQKFSMPAKMTSKKLTYRKIYMRSRSDHDRTKSKSVENDHEDSEIQNRDSPSVYTKYSSGSRIPNRPTTPGPYLERAVANPSPYIPKRPTTPGPFTRESWKRTNKKFNYTHLNKYSTHE